VNAQDVCDAAEADLKLILPADEYRTDAGKREVLKGLERLDNNAPVPQLSMFLRDEECEGALVNCSRRRMTGTLMIGGWVKPIEDQPLPQLLDLLHDIKRALRLGGNLLGIAQDVEYKGASLRPRGDNPTFAEVVAEYAVQWEEEESER
jgi:hypothetical protein